MAQDDKQTQAKQAQNDIHSAVDELMGKEHGRVFLRHVLGMCGVFAKTSTSELNTVMYLEGRRSVGIDIISILNTVDADNFSKLMEKSHG